MEEEVGGRGEVAALEGGEEQDEDEGDEEEGDDVEVLSCSGIRS